MDKTKKNKPELTIAKLSAIMPADELDKVKTRLTSLRQLIQNSAELGEDMSGIVADLRAVPAPGGEMFVFTPQLSQNVTLLKTVFRDCNDVKFRFFKTGGRQALLVSLDGLTDATALELNILKPLMTATTANSDFKKLIEEKLTVAALNIEVNANRAIEAVMSGNALVMIDGMPEMLLVDATKHVKRSVSTPVLEESLRGPQDAFNETLADNIVLLRRRSKDPNMKIRVLEVGERSKTAIALIYSANLVKPGLMEEVERRLSDIDTDAVFVSKAVEEAIVEHPWTPFPQLESTERPEKVMASIYEGRVAILVDNTPASVIIPCTYASVMQAVDDYTIPASVACLVRVSRHVAAFMAIYLPALYIAIVSYHPGMLPTGLAISLAELRSRTPFPSFLEALLMEVLLELFQEAITRLPKKVSSAASMVGAFVIGTTVVQAGLVNPFLVVVIATTAIASYVMPFYSFGLGLRALRVPILFLAAALGLYGVMLGLIIITVHLCSLKNFGESYLGGMLDIDTLADVKDRFIRAPGKFLKTRPIEFGAQDRERAGDS
ncbi:spore germination protein [Sporomusa malonica]|uniref:Spore germination protein n=1 Tax=Sporomusa malonica TaxID=112901 RepID=A0A1W2E539_9FIRM|nr:spore germination protein [Sporomusa malonica]SMD04532.1 spore germination protein [Sporomusa malonica]